MLLKGDAVRALPNLDCIFLFLVLSCLFILFLKMSMCKLQYFVKSI